MTGAADDLKRRDELLRHARQAMENDNLAYAEALSQEIIALEAEDGVAWAIRAHIAGLIGLEDKAVGWGARANPNVLAGFDRPRHEKVQALLAGCGRCPDEERFLLIKSLGYDFWTEIFHVFGGLLLAEITNRQPCVLWGANTPFLHHGTDNAFPQFFNGIGTELLMFLRAAPADEIFPGKWRTAGIDAAKADTAVPPHHGGEGKLAALWLLNRPERVVVSDFLVGIVDLLAWIPEDHSLAGLTPDEIIRRLIEKYLVPNWRIRDRVAEQMGLLGGRKILAVHIQGAEEPDAMPILERINSHYPAIVEQATAKDYAVWLMTDYQPYVDEYRARFGDAIICQESLRTLSTKESHAAVGLGDPQRFGEELVTDVLVAASCDRFVGNGAFDPSCMVDFLMAGDATKKHLFLPNQNRRRLLHLYRD
ncbi:MAG: hypothetical protein O3C49_02915 [Proteobacteria bacterium]|nr:hypothetical protein [Pseudomonadota bacterium]MDA1324575.1 hypothetical protein [Pseudomonadota bacterium]